MCKNKQQKIVKKELILVNNSNLDIYISFNVYNLFQREIDLCLTFISSILH